MGNRISFTHTAPCGRVLLQLKLKKKYGIPYVLTEHQGLFGQKSNFSREQIKDAYIPLYREAFSGADYIIPVSEQQIPKIKSFLSKEVPFKVISNMIDTTFFYKKEVDRNDQKFIFFAANSYFQEKGYDILLPAFDLVCKKSDQVELRIAGRYFSKPEFQNILKNCEYSDRITFCGYLSPSGVREELWNANAFVLSSRTEAQPLSFLEALSTGKPVVCTEVVPTGTFLDFCGYRVPVEDINALATAMINMTINYQDFDKKRIAEHLRDLASPDVVAWEIYHIYTEILHSKNH